MKNPKSLVLLPMLAGASPCRADTIRWNNPASGIWSAGAHWTTGVIPDADSLVIIDAQDVNLPDYTVTLDAAATISTLTLSTTTGGFSASGHPLTVTGQTAFSTGMVSATDTN